MIRPGPEKHGVWPNLSLDNALLILGVIAMAQDAIFVLAAIATIVGAAAAVGSLALSVALLLPRGKTRADDQEGKKNGR